MVVVEEASSDGGAGSSSLAMRARGREANERRVDDGDPVVDEEAHREEINPSPPDRRGALVPPSLRSGLG